LITSLYQFIKALYQIGAGWEILQYVCYFYFNFTCFDIGLVGWWDVKRKIV